MAEEKYAKYVLNQENELRMKIFDPVNQLHPGIGFRSAKFWEGETVGSSWTCISRPLLMDPYPMIHDECDEYLCFIGGDPRNMFDFGAEIELYLGEEEEKHVITSATIVYIPRGLPHCPLNFKKVEKPVLFTIIESGGGYKRRIKKDGKWSRARTFDEELREEPHWGFTGTYQ